MIKTKVTKADRSVSIVEDKISQKCRYCRQEKFVKFEQRKNVIQLILTSLKEEGGQTTMELSESTKIPEHYLNRYLLDLERGKMITRRGSKHYLVENPLKSV